MLQMELLCLFSLMFLGVNMALLCSRKMLHNIGAFLQSILEIEVQITFNVIVIFQVFQILIAHNDQLDLPINGLFCLILVVKVLKKFAVDMLLTNE